MIKAILFLITFFISVNSFAQGYVTYYYDPKNFKAVVENHSMRLANEALYINYTNQAKENANTIKDNLTKYVAVKVLITESLTNVNETLKSGRTIKRIYATIEDIMTNISKLSALAESNPEYLPLVKNFTTQTYQQSIGIVEDVTNFVHGKDTKNVLMSYQERAALLRKIDTRLCVINGTIISMCRCIEQAKFKGFFWHINPFKDYIEQDRLLIQQIIFQANSF